MDSKVGLFIDVNDQYYRINKKWEGRKLNYTAYLEKAKEFGEVSRAFAYGSHINNKAATFISALMSLGFETKFKRIVEKQWYNWAVGMSMDVVKMAVNDRIDTVVIGHSGMELVPLVNFIKQQGIRAVVIGCNINKELREAADRYIEISEDMLEEKVNIPEIA